MNNVEDVTEAVHLQRWLEEPDLVLREQRASLAALSRRVGKSQQQLRAAQAQLSKLLRADAPSVADVQDLVKPWS